MAIIPKGRFDPKRRIGNNDIVLEPDVAKAFPDDEAVNEAWRLILKASKRARHAQVNRGKSQLFLSFRFLCCKDCVTIAIHTETELT
jgi:hypothetical protein